MRALILSTLLCATSLQAQLAEPRIPVADQKVTNRQAAEIFKTLRAVNFEARKVVFPVYAGRERVAYGISIGEDRLLTKASEVVQRRLVFTENREKEVLAAQLVGIYPEHDLAVLKVPGLKAAAAKWADAEALEEGAFLTAIRTDGEAAAVGVLSVRERSLKSTDQGFLGVTTDTQELQEGVLVLAVEPGSAAAEVGIRRGDVISKIDDDEIRGSFELSTRLRRLTRGEQPEIELLRSGRTIKVKPTLKGRRIQEGESPRLAQMDRMSGTQSRVRGNFGNVIQSDMELEASDVGLPVVDLEGQVVGMVIARAGRISTLILPGDDIAKALEDEPKAIVQQRRQARRQALPEEARRARMEKELEMMQRIMENLRRELGGE